MNALFHGGVFGWHPERVPAHRVKHFVAGHPLVARNYVAHRVVADMADMDPARRIGKHFEHVAARLGGVVVGDKGRLVMPNLLPPRVGDVRVKTLYVGHRELPGDC